MTRLLRFRDLRAMGLFHYRSTLKYFQDRHGFPRGQKIGPNTRVWEEAEVSRWLKSRGGDDA